MDAINPYPEIPLQGNTITAQLFGDDTACAGSITVRSASPILGLCKQLLAAGHHPATPLVAYRRDVLCLFVASIGEAAGLEISAHGVGFRPLSERGRRPVVRFADGGRR